MKKIIKRNTLPLDVLPIISSVNLSSCIATVNDTQKKTISKGINDIISQRQVKYTGRFDFSNPEGPIFAWSGCSIAISFKGTSVSAKLKPVNPNMIDNWVNIIVDNNKSVPLNINEEKNYILASNLENNEHKVEIFKRTEALCGELQFMGFKLPEGAKLLAPPSTSERKIEIIGDSITCGYSNEATCVEDGFKESQENNYLTYGPITARNLSAELNIISWSGKGMYQNYDGVRDIEMPKLYLRTLPEREDSTWNFNSYTPSVVVINLGTNDFSVDTIDISKYVSTYKEFVTNLRKNYTKAHIFCTIGPMNQNPGEYVDKMVKELKNGGDEHIHYLEFEPQDIDVNGVGGDWHPSLKTHAIMAELLTEEIRKKLGW